MIDDEVAERDLGEVGNRSSLSSSDKTDDGQDLLDRERKAHDRCKVIAKLIAWQIDLTARIKVQQTEVAYAISVAIPTLCKPRPNA